MAKRLLFGFLLVFLLAGCRTVKYVPVVSTRDSVVLRLQKDSVYFRDSVFVNQWMQGDTVYRDKVKTTFLYKDRVRVDTVMVQKRDTVTVVQEVERKATWKDKALFVFDLLGVLLVLVLAVCLLKALRSVK